MTESLHRSTCGLRVSLLLGQCGEVCEAGAEPQKQRCWVTAERARERRGGLHQSGWPLVAPAKIWARMERKQTVEGNILDSLEISTLSAVLFLNECG